MMLGQLLTLVCLVAAATAKQCAYPNGTATAVHFYACDKGPLSTTAFKITNKDGKVVYPVHIFDLNVHQTIENKGPKYDKLFVNVTVSDFKNTLFKPTCHWAQLPTFGLTSNLNWCEQSKSCPVKPGTNKIVYKVNLDPFKTIIDLLSETPAYELRFDMHTPDKKPVGCLAIQTKLLKKA